MNKIYKSLIVAIVVLCCFAAGGVRAQIITNYVTDGNLESNYDIGCVSSESLSSKYSPADLYKGLARCIEDGNYESGVLLAALIGVYSRFDTFRVADESAHQASVMLRMTHIGSLDESKIKIFSDNLKETLGSPDGLKRICGEVRKIGAPTYFPRYMIQHGMGAVLSEMGAESGDSPKGGLIDGFEPESAWEKSLYSYLHCPKV